MSNTNAVRELRGPKYENWPLGDPRAAAPGKYDLKSGENGHLARANGATGGPYCSPALPSVYGRQFEPLAGWGVVLGHAAAPALPSWRFGRFFKLSA